MSSGDSDLRAHAARVAALPLAALRLRLLKKALLWGLAASAEDLAQVALTKLVQSAGVGWDHAADPTAWTYLVHAMDEHRKNARRRETRRRTDLDTETGEEAPPSSDSGPQTTLLAREEASWAREELRKRLADAPIALRMIDAHINDGFLEPSEMAEQLGEDVSVIYRWNAKIVREMDRVHRDWGARNAEVAS